MRSGRISLAIESRLEDVFLVGLAVVGFNQDQLGQTAFYLAIARRMWPLPAYKQRTLFMLINGNLYGLIPPGILLFFGVGTIVARLR